MPQAIHHIDVKRTLMDCISTDRLVHELNLPSVESKSPKASETSLIITKLPQ